MSFTNMAEGQDLYMKAPCVPVKDVNKRLPPTKPSCRSQLVSIRESSKESDNRRTMSPINSSSSGCNSDRSMRKKRSISLFPDPAKHQSTKSVAPQLRITIPLQESKVEVESKEKVLPVMAGEEGLTGLAKAKRRALERRREGSPLFEDLNRKQQDGISPNTVRTEEIRPAKEKQPDPSSTSMTSLPNRLRNKFSATRLKRHSRSLESYFNGKGDPVTSPESVTTSSSIITPTTIVSTIDTPPSSITTSMSRKLETPPLSARRSKSAVDVRSPPPTHLRQKSSHSSIESPIPGLSSDENSESSTKKHNRKGSSSSTRSKLPKGLSPTEAAKCLPTSVITALATHAQSESMSYPVLLPHQVVHLNNEHLGLEKEIEGVKKELNAVRHQSAELHERMLDELRLCASTSATDSRSMNRLLQLQIDVATIEVRLDHTTRRLAKMQHRRADVRERLLMHLAGTHAMLVCERHLQLLADATPPVSPV